MITEIAFPITELTDDLFESEKYSMRTTTGTEYTILKKETYIAIIKGS